MLVLTRRIGEAIIIGDDVRVIVLESRSGQVKLGIEAPRSLGVVREELRDVDTRNAVREAASSGHGRDEQRS